MDTTLLLVRISQRTLAGRPVLALRVVRLAVRRAARRRAGEPFTTKGAAASLMGRVIDVHPATARVLLRLGLRRAARRRAGGRVGRR